ncbi:hypothetical protein GCM10010236_81570 [Streptomyces eurythermus]|nr:hypothetical protein GCM10010236_81570 [Streptomyces eurythermus]
MEVPVELLMQLIRRQSNGPLRQGKQVRAALAQPIDSHTLITAQLFSGLGVETVVGVDGRTGRRSLVDSRSRLHRYGSEKSQRGERGDRSRQTSQPSRASALLP